MVATTYSDVLEFKKIVDNLIEKTEEYSKQVEAARLKVSANKTLDDAMMCLLW